MEGVIGYAAYVIYSIYGIYIALMLIIILLIYKFFTSSVKKYMLVKREQIAAMREQNEALREIAAAFKAQQSKESPPSSDS